MKKNTEQKAIKVRPTCLPEHHEECEEYYDMLA